MLCLLRHRFVLHECNKQSVKYQYRLDLYQSKREE